MNETDKEIWQQIEKECDQDDHFLRHRWFEAWSKNNSPVEYKSFKDPDGKVAIFPYFEKLIGFFRFVSLAGYYYPHRAIPNNGTSDNLTQQIIEYLDDKQCLTGIHLGPIKNTDAFVLALIDRLKEKQWKIESSVMDVDFGREVPDTVEEYLATLSKKRKKKTGAFKRKLEQLGEVEIIHYRNLTQDGWRKIFKELESVESKAWIAQTGVPHFVGKQMQDFWNNLTQDEWYCSAINAWMIYLDKNPISFNAGIDLGQQRFVFSASYDQEYAKHSTGRVLELELMKTTIEEQKVKFLNCGQGDYGYKTQWGYYEFQQIKRHLAFPPSLLGRLAHLGYKISRKINQLRG